MKALAVTAGIVFWTLVLGVGWLALFPGTSEEPVAILQIEPAPTAPPAGAENAPAAAMPEGPAASGASSAAQPGHEGLPLPPGFAVPQGAAPVAPPPPQAPDATLVPALPPAEAPVPPADGGPAGGQDQQGALPATGTEQTAAVPPPPPPPPGPESETAQITLPPVPVPELVEESQYGPLPKVAADGRRPIEVYARPSRYAAAGKVGGPPRVAVLVTGLGLPNAPSADVLKGLPAPVSIAYGAYGRSLQDGVAKLRAEGHEVLLQIPLEPANYPTEDPGPHTLLTTLPPEENLKRLQWLMSRYTGYVGVTNHMGAKFKKSAEALQPVFEELKRRGLLYVDDGSVEGSAAGSVASALGLYYSVASVQIDSESAAEIDKQFAKLEEAAKTEGAAIGVVRAKPAAVKRLNEWAAKLEAKGIVLVPVSAAVRSLQQS